MNENRRTVAASINPRTAGLWANFLLLASRRNLSTTRALELAAELWLKDAGPEHAAPAPETEPEWLPAIPVPESVISSGLPEDPEPQGPVYVAPTHNPFA